MVEANRSMMVPPIETLLEKAGSKFVLVSLAAQRARQINDYYSKLGEGLGSIVPPQVESTSTKSLSIAFDEIAAGKIVPERVEEEPEEAE
ncbi:DNA-directed RNA polymerase subunit omega [Ferrithrix thermotolerans DSM 19514]|uniref:DNA-directed RNA polymerase subunit omega n=1 Tax=Ferrithrix thermotolerans DSM 19514 TaxID=1121881 RepID=A0A1M4T700_9ACTN|nr:DNA-directed RNA polymerase subunit omega [Ferrithrix thermotolerans]SHE40239.1 DNA-directed RNA polymerase subunit omega [Ferrithrix thermotolerans DSM 19514]